MPNIAVTDDLGSWMGLRPEMAGGLVAFSDAVYGRSALPLRVREIARMRIALANECEVCRGARYSQPAAAGLDEAFYAQVPQWRSSALYSPHERLAAEYAERFALDHTALRADADFWQRLRAQFSDAEVVDLALCCALWLGAGRTMRTLDVGQGCTLTLDRPS